VSGWAFYNAADESVLTARASDIRAQFVQVEAALGEGELGPFVAHVTGGRSGVVRCARRFCAPGHFPTRACRAAATGRHQRHCIRKRQAQAGEHSAANWVTLSASVNGGFRAVQSDDD
jgi:hypothetical protein